jgi:hypothetical protein
MKNKELEINTASLQASWPKAKKVWSDFVRLREPEWCLSGKEAEREGLSSSFAMIRLSDHRIVIDVSKMHELALMDYGVQILAHEIGHHIYTPGNLNDNASIQAKIRWSLAGIEEQAPMVANLYEDLLINDRLHHQKGLDMAIIYKKLNESIHFSKLWTLYMRTYEHLWRLKKGELIPEISMLTPEIDADASILSAIIRSYAKNWLEGASRFGALLYSYLMEEEEARKARQSFGIILDADLAGLGGGVVTGMVGFDEDLQRGIMDPRGEALASNEDEKKAAKQKLANLLSKKGGMGPEQRYLSPGVYIDLQQQVNPQVNKQELLNNYYKEIALPYLIDFPCEIKKNTAKNQPEGLEFWDIGDSADEIDWIESTIYSPLVIPGVNTLKRTYGFSDDEEETEAPLDVYIGIDCSGSMGNPSRNFSWPVLAASIVGLSALRSGAKVFGCLSGEPGKYLQTKDYEKNEKVILSVLTSYLGTGYAYGVARLKDVFDRKKKEKSHVIVVTDDDIFSMLDAKTDNGDNNWEIIEQALQNAGGTGTLVLHSNPKWHSEEAQRLRDMGWHIYYVTNESELLTFASEFAKVNY